MSILKRGRSPHDIPGYRRDLNTHAPSVGGVNVEHLQYLKVVLSEAPLVVHHQVQPLSAGREYVVLQRHGPGSTATQRETDDQQENECRW